MGLIIKVVKQNFNECVAEAARLLLKGDVVAIPTDTIYGLACIASSAASVQSLYDIKMRDERKPVAICVSDIHQIRRYSEVTVSQPVLEALLPGPVTLVFQRSNFLGRYLNPGVDTIGVRIPDLAFCTEVIRATGGEALALTSANLSNGPSATCVEEFEEIWPQVSAIFDGGQVAADTPRSCLGSTVVDLSVSGTFRIIRAGCARKATSEVLTSHGLKEIT